MPKISFDEYEDMNIDIITEIEDYYIGIFDVDQATLDRWTSVMEAFRVVQNEMYDIYYAEINKREREADAERLRLLEIEDSLLFDPITGKSR